MAKKLNWPAIEAIIRNALAEDIGSGDVTTESVTRHIPVCTAEIISKNEGILARLNIAERAFALYDENLQITRHAEEGAKLRFGEKLMTISGTGAAILAVERTDLNLLGRASGIASMTNKVDSAAAGTKAKIHDTRRQAPLLRELDKYGGHAGGGQNNRTRL